MKKLVLLLSLFAASSLWAQNSDITFYGTLSASSTDCSVANSCLSVPAVGYGMASVAIRGTFTGVTIVFEFSDDGGVTWFQDTCARSDTNIQEGSEAVTNSTPRAWDCGVAASKQFRTRVSAYTSGNILVGITLTVASIEPAQTVAISQSSSLPGGVAAEGATSSGNPLQVGGKFETTPTTLTNGQQGVLQQDSAQNLLTIINPSTSGGITPIVSTTTEAAHILKASAGNFYGACITTGGTAGFMMVFNATTAPADGAVTPTEWLQIAANSTACLTYGSGPPNAYATGITLVFSSTGPFTKTASATAAFVGRVK